MTYCEDAPCCGCCGTSVYGPAEGYYHPEDDFLSDLPSWADEPDYCEGDSDYCPDRGCENCEGHDENDDVTEPYVMEDAWLDGSYEE